MQVLHLPNRDHRNDGVTTLKCASTHVPRFLTGSDPPISDRQLPFGCSIAQAVTTAHRRAAARNSFLKAYRSFEDVWEDPKLRASVCDLLPKGEAVLFDHFWQGR